MIEKDEYLCETGSDFMLFFVFLFRCKLMYIFMSCNFQFVRIEGGNKTGNYQVSLSFSVFSFFFNLFYFIHALGSRTKVRNTYNRTDN